MVYGRPPDGPSPEGTVWLAMADGSLDVKLTDGSTPRLSPDRNQVAFLRGSPGAPLPNLWTKDLSKGSEDVVKFVDGMNGPISDIAFLPDGTGIDAAYDCLVETVGLSGLGAVLYQGNPCSFADLAVNPVDGRVIVAVVGSGIFDVSPLPAASIASRTARVRLVIRIGLRSAVVSLVMLTSASWRPSAT